MKTITLTLTEAEAERLVNLVYIRKYDMRDGLIETDDQPKWLRVYTALAGKLEDQIRTQTED